MKPIYPSISLLLSLLIMSGESRAQDNVQVLDSSYTIAYTSKGVVKIYSSDKEGISNIKSIKTKGDYLALSPDGNTFAFRIYLDGGKTWSIYTMNIDGTNIERLTHAKNKWDSAPAWTPDGDKIAFAREYKDSEGVWQAEIWIMNSDGSERTQIKSLKGSNPYFTPDGKIVFSSEHKDKKSEISIADFDGSNVIHLTNNAAEEWHPDVSPDGKQIAFMSNRDGNYEIYVMNIDGSDQKRLTFNNAGNWHPSWSPDGVKIIFSSSSTDKESHIYMMNKDGSSVQKIISHGRKGIFQR
ncbi:TolB family protein [Thalassotalea hakodatensis]|uniref:TolB family protein n=1 Tax=Thalassotalea hakodatensis TaxID=3030492 RepID=UPI0025723BBE|nr:DUF5050 domain-containing protein [Thalassotalea hakodatensis]